MIEIQNIVQGLTNEIHFDMISKMRDTIYIEVLELSKKNDELRFQKFAYYDNYMGLQLLRNFSNIEDETMQTIHKKLFRVIMHEGMPFLRTKLVYSV